MITESEAIEDIEKALESGVPDGLKKEALVLSNIALKKQITENPVRMDNRKLIEEIISTIESEFEKSNHTQYKCNNGRVILTDVGYVESWFKEYKDILREKYCK